MIPNLVFGFFKLGGGGVIVIQYENVVKQVGPDVAALNSAVGWTRSPLHAAVRLGLMPDHPTPSPHPALTRPRLAGPTSPLACPAQKDSPEYEVIKNLTDFANFAIVGQEDATAYNNGAADLAVWVDAKRHRAEVYPFADLIYGLIPSLVP